MKQLFYITIFLTFFNSITFAQTAPVFDKMEKELASGIVKDLSTKQLVFAKDINKKVRPASLTKIMTCVLAIESGKMNKVVTITKPMTQISPTIVNVKVGEQFYLKDLVHVALIKSANDAANSIAYYLGNGDKDKFIDMMNAKARQLGMDNTHFSNPCGFDTPNHISTAKDLMRLTEYAIQSRTFNNIVKLNKYSFKAINTNSRYSVITSNKLQRTNKEIVGIKTGFTNGAGPCLIARAKKNNKDILLVMLNAGNRWENAKNVINAVASSKTQPKIEKKSEPHKKSISDLFNS